MKEASVNLKAFRSAMERSLTNTIAFENCTEFIKYNNSKYTDPINLCLQNNYILNEVVPYLKTVSTIKTYGKEKAEPYYGKPMKLSYEEYGITDYWWIILAVNDYFFSQDFINWENLIIPSRAEISKVMDKALYSNDSIGKYTDGL